MLNIRIHDTAHIQHFLIATAIHSPILPYFKQLLTTNISLTLKQRTSQTLMFLTITCVLKIRPGGRMVQALSDKRKGARETCDSTILDVIFIFVLAVLPALVLYYVPQNSHLIQECSVMSTQPRVMTDRKDEHECASSSNFIFSHPQ